MLTLVSLSVSTLENIYEKSSPPFCFLLLNLFISLGTRYMLGTVLFSLSNLKCLAAMWQALFLIYNL